jgi:predicted helicase
MSQVLINKYLTELAKLRQVGGTSRESVVRKVSKDPLKALGRTLDLPFIPESVTPFVLTRADVPDDKSSKAGLAPKAMLKADKAAGLIRLDSETTLSGIPSEAWDYKLRNRSALEWILDQHKEKTPKDPTIRERFNTYRFADHKEEVIDLLMWVTTLSVETVKIVDAMRSAQR